MDAYTSFAEVYDMFMDNVPYEEWTEYLCSILREYHIEDGILLDLGCGTGNMTRLFAEKGYDMIGIDNSMEMLDIARNRQDAGKLSESAEILYLLQDMRSFELYGTVRAVYSACDCLNYILDEDELRTVFRLVNNYLDPRGIFVFDMNTVFKYEEMLADNTFAENREESSFIWENYYDPESRINEYDLTLFVKEAESDHFLRYRETHYQRGYSVEQVQRLLEEAGMEFIAAYDGYTKQPLCPDSERMTIVAAEKGK
jgi:SAM-dependent methyltransferase